MNSYPPYDLDLEVQASTFSDLIVRVVPINRPEELPGLLVYEGGNVSWIQWALLHRQLLVRGAITIGNIFIDDEMVFGPGLNRAHLLESKHSLNPRVIVDPVAFEEAIRVNRSTKLEGWNPREALQIVFKRDFDGFRFVDYLSTTALKCIEDRDASSLMIHKNKIIEGLAASDLSVRTKYEWLCSYHNETVEFFAGDLTSRCKSPKDDLVIQSNQ